MDSENALPDQGTPLPLPCDIDRHGHAYPEGSPSQPGGLDTSSLDGSLVEQSNVGNLFGEETPWPVSDGEAAMGGSHVAEQDEPPHDDVLTDQDRATLDAMVHQAMLGASLQDGLSLPWETGIMATIFGDAPLVTLPEVPQVAHSIDPANIEPAVAETHTKRARTDAFTCRLYERAIAFRNTLSDLEMDHAKWNKALEKLYTVMVSGPSSCPSGVKFDPLDMDRNLQQIRVLCGARSPNTISKRANSLLQFCLWHRGFYYRKHPIPFEQGVIADYVWEKHQDGMTYSGLESFVEAVNFGTYVLGLPVLDPSVPIVSNFVKGILDKKALTRPQTKQGLLQCPKSFIWFPSCATPAQTSWIGLLRVPFCLLCLGAADGQICDM